MISVVPLFADAGDPPGRVARLSYITGNVSFEPSGEEQWSQASVNYPLTTGDRLYTDREARAEMETGNIAIRLAPDTDLTTTNLSDQLLQIGLAQGTLRVRAYDIRSGNSVEIDTPNAALTLLRAGSYRVETYPDGGTTLVAVNDGDLEISGPGISQTLHAGQAVKLTGTDQIEMEWLSAPSQDDFDQWCVDRDRHFLSSNSRQYVGSYVPGYADLDQYGSWEANSDYGKVWYPAGLAEGWVPYRQGRWAWVEPWGWTWIEEEPWGFTPFHYGRWVSIGPRWGWIPGPVAIVPIYAPALVAFAGGPNPDLQIWFPLGPRDPYFPWYHHTDVYLRQVNVTNVRVVNIVNVLNVRNVTDIHYAYQRVAPTACTAATFRTSRPVGRELVRVNADEVGRERIIPHPELTPDVRASRAGRPLTHPPAQPSRPRIENRIVSARPVAPQTERNVPPQAQRPGMQVERNNPPERDRSETTQSENAARGRNARNGGQSGPGSSPGDRNPSGNPATQPPGRNRDWQQARPMPAVVPAAGGPAGGPPQERRPLVTKNPAPQSNPPFGQRQNAMGDHPGRPLEPQQMDNLRRGQEPGPRQDREFPPHHVSASPRQSAPPARHEAKPSVPTRPH